MKYDSKQKQKIHQLIETIFNGYELNKFVTDHFPAVSTRFTPEMDNASKIKLLIEHCANRDQLGKLVANIRETKPEAYGAFEQQQRVHENNPDQITRNPEELLHQSLADRYQIEEILDKDGLGAVFKAYDTHLEIDVAIKVILLDRVKQPALQERVQQEVRTAIKLDHPGIVQIYDFGQVASLLYIIMEFIPGYNLRQTREFFGTLDRGIALSEALELVQQICLTVDYMHQQRVLHPGTKPENIMLKTDPTSEGVWQPVMINLGLLRPHRETLISEQNITVRRLTYSVSPELLLGHHTDIRTDVYALGIVLYNLAVGRPPFRPRNLMEATRLHVKEPPPLPRSIKPTIPEAVEQIILKSLAKDPADRYLSARGLAQALGDYLEETLHPAIAAPQAGVEILTEPGPLAVIPGEGITTRITLHNKGEQVYHCQVKILGIPAEWILLSPSSTTLLSNEREEIELTIQPPRSPESQFKHHALTIQVVNQQDLKQIDEVKKTLTVAPYVQFNSTLWPQEISTGQVAQVTIENQGNTSKTFTIQPKLDESLTFQPNRAQLELLPGESGTVDFRISPSSRPWFGEIITQSFSLEVGPPEDQATHEGQVTSQGILSPRGVQVLALTFGILLCVVIFSYPVIRFSETTTSATVVQNAADKTATIVQIAVNETAAVEVPPTQTAQAQKTATQAAIKTATWQSGDKDHDGLTNSKELEIGTDPNNKDTDEDGLYDGAEVEEFFTNPFNKDTDYDGVPDNEEVRLQMGPGDRDTDRDGTPDSIDEDPGRPPTPTSTVSPNPTPQIPIVRFDNRTYTVDERQQTAIITVILVDTPADKLVTVNYITRDDTATEGKDYRGVSGALFFEPNETVQEFTVSIISDSIDELDEKLTLHLENPQGAKLDSADKATLTIRDNNSANEQILIRFGQPAPLFGLPSYPVWENQDKAIIDIVLSDPAPWNIYVDYTTKSDTATPGGDYQHTSGSLVFEPGENRKTFEITISEDRISEEDESVIVSLSNARGASIDTPQAKLVIEDND